MLLTFAPGGVAKTVNSINALAANDATHKVDYKALAPIYTLADGSTTNVTSITPAVTVELDYQNMQSYKKIKAELDKKEIGNGLALTLPTPRPSDTSGLLSSTTLFGAGETTVTATNLQNAYTKAQIM